MKNTRLFPLFLLTSILGGALAWSGYHFAKTQGLIGPQFSLYIQTDSGADLFQGMKVTYKGFRLGKLTELELTPAGQVVGRVDIQQDRASFFTQGAILKVSKEKIITSELVLVPSVSAGAPMADRASIDVVRESVANDLAHRIDPLLTQVNVLLQQLSDPKLGVQATLTQSRMTMNETSQLILKISDPQRGLPQVLTHTGDTMISAQELVKQLNDPQRGLGPTLHNANNLMLKADGALNDVEHAPMYRWLVPKTSPSKEVLNAPAPSKD